MASDAGPEISDLIIDYDPVSLARRPVYQRAVLERLPRRAHPIVSDLRAVDGILDPNDVDRVLLSSHLELQRLHEEFANGWRMRLILQALVQAIRQQHSGRPVRIVDVGCGLGFVVRWL